MKYCSVECQKNHRPQHKKACKKQMAAIRDDQLFQQPDESHLGECPICFLSLPFDEGKSTINSCCCQRICNGCAYANMNREEALLQHPKCAFCREPLPKTDKEMDRYLMKRVKANDPVAMHYVAKKRHGEGDYDGAFGYFKKATELGDMDAHYNLSTVYDNGEEGVEMDLKKEIHHLEEAAIGGHPKARYDLGCIEEERGKYERAAKHFIIAAKLGHDEALDAVKQGFRKGHVSKEDYASSLRGHQAAVAATKSTQREEAYAFFNQRRRV